MEAEIGTAAGLVWRQLEPQRPKTLRKLKTETKLSDQLLLLALGWLAREGKLDFAKNKKSLTVTLKGW
jgi:hypothetical protein